MKRAKAFLNKMRRSGAGALMAALSVFMAIPASAEPRVDRPLFSKYDLDTPTITATTNYIVTSVNLANGALTLAHQPDTPRNLTGTVTDTGASIVAGTVTFVGTDVNGNALTDVWNLATSLTYTGTVLFKTLTSATVADATVLDGGGDETIVVGVGSVTSYVYCSYSQSISVTERITTSGSSTTVTAVAGNPFTDVAVGDEITATGILGSNTRVVTARGSASSITVDSAVDLSQTGGYAFTYRDLTCGYAETSGWIRVGGTRQTVGIVVRSTTNTGNVKYVIEGRQRGPLGKPIPLASGTLSSAAVTGLPDTTSATTVEIDDTTPEIRVGLKFGTTDDASDTGTESIDVTVSTEGAPQI